MNDKPNKIYTNKTISIATFFGGPLAAGFLIAHNFKVFGNKSAANKTLLIGILVTLLLFALIYSLPNNLLGKLPSTILPAVYTAIIALLVEKYQGDQIKEFLQNQGQKASGLTAAGFGVLGLSAIILFIIAISSVYPFPGYEKQTLIGDKKVSLHYSKKIDEDQINLIKLLITQSGFIEESPGADLFLSGNSEKYILKFIIDPKALSDSVVVSDFMNFKKYLNYNTTGDKNIEIAFTDALLLKDYKLPKYLNSQTQTNEEIFFLHVYQINENHTIHYNAPTSLDEIKKVEIAIKKLQGYFPVEKQIDIIFLDKGEKYQIKFFVNRNLWNIPGTIERLKSTVDYIIKNGLNKEIDIFLVDSTDLSEKLI